MPGRVKVGERWHMKIKDLLNGLVRAGGCVIGDVDAVRLQVDSVELEVAGLLGEVVQTRRLQSSDTDLLFGCCCCVRF